MKALLVFFFLCFIIGCSSNGEDLVKKQENEQTQSKVINTEVRIDEDETDEEKTDKTETEGLLEDENEDEMLNEEYISSNENIGFIDIEDLKLNNLYLDMPYSELSRVMGPELERTTEDDLGDDGITYRLTYVDGTNVLLMDDEIYSIEVTSTEYETPRGLRVGDSMEKVVELYKNPAYTDDNNWHYTTTKDYNLFTLEFIEDTVSKIKINLVM